MERLHVRTVQVVIDYMLKFKNPKRQPLSSNHKTKSALHNFGKKAELRSRIHQ